MDFFKKRRLRNIDPRVGFQPRTGKDGIPVQRRRHGLEFIEGFTVLDDESVCSINRPIRAPRPEESFRASLSAREASSGEAPARSMDSRCMHAAN